MKTQTKTLAALIALACGAAHAGVTTDGTLAPAQTLTGPNYAIGAALGKTAGNNLFHSFGQFSLQNGESATFSGPANIANVISRVTGGAASTIAGQINVGIAGANLYFINPAGIVFNNGASLNVPGAVLFSTASGLHFPDGAAFGEAAGEPDALTFSGAPAAIAVLGASLTAAKGKTLALVGGNVTLGADPAVAGSTAALNAPSGNVVVLSLGNGNSNSNSFSVALPSYAVPAGTPGGTLTLAAGARIVSSENAGDTTGAGSITLHAGQLNASGADIHAETSIGNSGGVDIRANAVTLDNTAINTATIGIPTTGTPGNAGPISISAGTIDIVNQTQIDSSSDPADRNVPHANSGNNGSGGDIALTASGRISITGCAACLVPTAVVSNTFGGGKAGNITLTSGQDVTLTDYAVVQSDSIGSGAAGSIQVSAAKLDLSGGAQLSTSAHFDGRGGDITLALGEGLSVSGQGLDSTATSVASGIFANTFAAGAGGRIDIAAASVGVKAGGQISSSNIAEDPALRQLYGTVGQASGNATGNAGSITINASRFVEVSGRADMQSGILVNALQEGSAGDVTIASPALTVSNGGLIQSQNSRAGVGGNIHLNVKQLAVSGAGQISVKTLSSQAGGNIVINADTVSLTGADSGLYSTTEPVAQGGNGGNGGSVSISAKAVTLNDEAMINTDSLTLGKGGGVTITATDSVALNNATILARSRRNDSEGNGAAGTIAIDAGAALRMTGSRLKTSTEAAPGGNISIKARDLLYMQGSQIAAEAYVGIGDGGNITIDPVLTVMNQSLIVANAFGGNGGNIDITTGTFLKSPDSLVTASSQLGINGAIQISSPVLDLSAQIAPLPRFSGDLKLDNSPCAQARRSGNGFGITRAAGWRVGGTVPLHGTVAGAQLVSQSGMPVYALAAADPIALGPLVNRCVR